eukprot:TRINITY_DN13365_c0_g1_i2.p1 TRINITY_DN13365_c0_g1~~TRINITY_DN13365_c0_g1_i2.p1  ORF type:complete len:411 (-),score=50.37 TRINITY_DN13365_c0_g1_i2:42-1274(-)
MSLGIWLLIIQWCCCMVAEDAKGKARQPRILPIRSFKFGHLSYEDFYQHGPHSDRPLVITGIPLAESPCFGEHRNDSSHLLSMLKERCDGIIRSSPAETNALQDFIEMLQEEGGMVKMRAEHGPVLGLEYSVLANCDKNFWSQLRIPAFFTGDISLRAKTAKVKYGEDPAYPALTFSEPGFYTMGHVDSPNNEIWMAMCYGHKTVRVLPVSVVADHWGRGAHLERLAYGRLSDDEKLVVNLAFKNPLDLFNETFLDSELPGVPIYEGELRGGEVLYLPTAQAHAVISHDRGLYVISSWVDLNAMLPPNPNQLLEKLASCQRCGDGIAYMVNYSTAHGGPGSVVKCRRRRYCHNLVSWLLDETVRVPLLDSLPRGSDPGEQKICPRSNPRIRTVMDSGSHRLRKPVRQWFA